jgi:hypothetical protein
MSAKRFFVRANNAASSLTNTVDILAGHIIILRQSSDCSGWSGDSKRLADSIDAGTELRP